MAPIASHIINSAFSFRANLVIAVGNTFTSEEPSIGTKNLFKPLRLLFKNKQVVTVFISKSSDTLFIISHSLGLNCSLMSESDFVGSPFNLLNLLQRAGVIFVLFTPYMSKLKFCSFTAFFTSAILSMVFFINVRTLNLFLSSFPTKVLKALL